jgi:glyoxylase-like metal-dependent hydrolase (beta-lactamase superfamily II)
VRLAWEQLTAGVHRCRLPFCDVTVGLVCGRSGALLVDTGTTLREAAAIDADVRAIAGRAVTHVVLTHKHFDHVLGSSVFAGNSGAELYCAPAVVEYLASGADDLRADALSHGADAAEIDRAIAALCPPRRGSYDAVVDLGDRTVTITHLGGGHTSSDLVVVALEPDDRTVVFTGDLVEESADPAIDADSDVAAWPATLDRLLAVGGPQAIYVPGHGKVVDAGFVRRQRDWLEERAKSLRPRP